MSVNPTFRGVSVGLNPTAQASRDECAIILAANGVPSGNTLANGQELAASQAALCIRADAAAVDAALYFTVDGGTTWTAFSQQTSPTPTDSVPVAVGSSSDLSLNHNGTDSSIVNTTGHLTIDSQGATKNLRLDLGADTSATALLLRNNSGTTLLSVDGAGLWTTTIDQSVALTGTDELMNSDFTITHATQVGVGHDVTAAQLTNARTGGYVAGVRTKTTSLAGDLNGAIYAGVYCLAPTDGGGAAVHVGLYDAGNDYAVVAADNVGIGLGTGASGVPDIKIAWDGSKVAITQLTANSAIDMGVDGAGIDVIFRGDTAGAAITWDQSADAAVLSGVAKIKLQTIAAATGTAIPVTHSGSFPITHNGAETNTLAIPTYLGQTLSIFVDTDTSGARVITSAQRINQAGNTIMTLTEVGDFIKLEAISIGGALRWQVVANDGVALS